MDESTEVHTMKIADEQLIELYWQRNEKAIKETEVKYGKMLFRIAYNILHDKSDCEECQLFRSRYGIQIDIDGVVCSRYRRITKRIDGGIRKGCRLYT